MQKNPKTRTTRTKSDEKMSSNVQSKSRRMRSVDRSEGIEKTKHGSPLKQMKSGASQNPISSQSQMKEDNYSIKSKTSSVKDTTKQMSERVSKINKTRNKTRTNLVKKHENMFSETAKQQSKKKVAGKNLIRPSTSTLKKNEASINQDAPLKVSNDQKHAGTGIQSDDSIMDREHVEADSYEEDFEDYESDFEDSAVDSSSESEEASCSQLLDDKIDTVLDENIQKTSGLILHPTIVKRQTSVPSNIVEKKARTEFLKMSTRSSTFLVKESNDLSPVKQIAQQPRMHINFESAIKGQEKQKVINNIQKRGKDLLDLLSLDFISYDIFEMPSMSYDMFIKAFGHANFKQVQVQTEFCEDEDTQTDEIEKQDKWTQNPAYDHLGVGGDMSSIERGMDDWQSHFKIEALKLSEFLQNITPVFLNILSLTLPYENKLVYREAPHEMNFTSGCFILEHLSFCKETSVTYMCCPSLQATYFLAIHDNIRKLPISTPFASHKGIITIWNILQGNSPEMILIANSQPTCACFGPHDHDTVIAGMVDGSLMLWDLNESISHMHETYDNVSLRCPTYNTAAMVSQSHHSCVVAVQSFDYSKRQSVGEENSVKGTSYHVLSLDEMGVLNVWVIVEIPKSNTYDVDMDLGLAPGGKVKLTWSSSVSLVDMLVKPELFDLKTFDFRIFPNDGNHIIIATDMGIVWHFTRNGQLPSPRTYVCVTGEKFDVRCINFSPHNADLFVAGCSDGSAMIFNINKASALLTIAQVAAGEPVLHIEWSLNCPSVLYVLDSSSSIHIWNIMERSKTPKFSYSSCSSRILWFTLLHIQKKSNKTHSHDVPSHLVLARENSGIELHCLHSSIDVISTQEYESQIAFMNNL